MKLSIHLVAWNGGKYIPHLFDSLKNQTYRDWQILILDNNSSDGTIEAIKKELQGDWCEYQIIQSDKNFGFAVGHNRLFTSYKLPVTSYVLLLNQDMYLLPDCLEKLVKFMDEHPDAAAVSPRLMKWNFANTPPVIPPLLKGGRGDVFTNQIDSLGLKVLRSRRVVELGAGETWLNSFRGEPQGATRNLSEKLFSGNSKNISKSLTDDKKDSSPLASLGFGMNEIEVFGVSGALPMYRRSAINQVGLFDDSFGSYKEDVDLAFRLRSAGFKSFVVLDAVAYHDRSASGLSDLSDKTAIENKKKQSELIKYNSYKNHLMTLIKNEYWQNYLLDLPWIKWYELKKFLYFLLFDRKVLRGLGEIWRNREKIKNQKSKIKSLRRVDWREMREWWA